MIKFKMKKWVEKMSRPANLQIVTFPFVPPCNGLLIVQLRAKVQGRTYEIFNNAMPTIVDGYGVAGAYVSTVVFVEKGKQVSVSSNYNIDSTAHYFVPLVGGVLRNLSIFKAFRHFMSLQKGGGVDGQTGYKGITLQGSRKADQHRNGIHRKLDRVLVFCEPSTSDADTHTAGRNVHIAGSYTADEHCVILSELQYNSSAIQGGGRSGLFPHNGDSHRASRRIPAKFGINISDVFILGKGFNNSYPNRIALSERRCAA